MKLPITMLSQPDDTTCGPTSLHAVMTYYGYPISLDTVINEVGRLKDGGTLAVFLGIYALQHGFAASLYTYNLKVFDPSWFSFSSLELIGKLKSQVPFKKGKKIRTAIMAYVEFLEMGGIIRFDELDPKIIREPLLKRVPVLTGLSATYLYSSRREYTDRYNKTVYDDLKGEPMGHFVVLGGLGHNEVFVFDPYKDNPISPTRTYHVKMQKLINAILLGILTYDANLLVIEQRDAT